MAPAFVATAFSACPDEGRVAPRRFVGEGLAPPSCLCSGRRLRRAPFSEMQIPALPLTHRYSAEDAQ